MTPHLDMPPEAERHIAEEQVAWLTIASDRGAPSPNPVWFVADGRDLVVFSERDTHKVHNIEQRPTVTLHFNSDPAGGDIVVITGQVEVAHDQKPSDLPAYMGKCQPSITGMLA